MPAEMAKAVITISLCVAAQIATAQPLTTCACTTDSHEQWTIPSGSNAVKIASAANTTQCWQLTKTAGGVPCDGLCVVLGPCDDPDTPTWTINGQRIQVASPSGQAGWCLDENTQQLYMQAYPNCIAGDTHQLWSVDATNRVHELWTGQGLCVGVNDKEYCPAPPPPPFCYAYHSIHANGLYDPSGPLLAPDGTWHVWEDMQGWGHYTSKDLLSWTAVGQSTGFDGLTGSVAVTATGIYAFWPSASQGGVLSAVSTDPAGLSSWQQRGQAITAPPMAGGNFRDPLRAFQLQKDGPWFVGVGCNNASNSADLCLYRALDATLQNFTFVGPLYSTDVTYGQMDGNIVWQNVSVKATMMECPDTFALDSAWMLIGSLFTTNQWWIGNVTGDLVNGPTFTPTNVGMMDYGNFYAAKTGSTYAALPGDRRVLFGFTGWNEPTANAACGRALVIPRDVTLGPDGESPRFNPIPELATLRVPGSYMQADMSQEGASASLAGGAQVWVNLLCTLPSPLPSSGSVFTRVLGSPDGSQYTEVGYDFGVGALYADHSHCCAAANTIIQRAPVPYPSTMLGGQLNLTVLVDGSVVESFGNGVVTITSMVNPDPAAGMPQDRVTTMGSTAPSSVQCSAQSWQLQGIATEQRRGFRPGKGSGR